MQNTKESFKRTHTKQMSTLSAVSEHFRQQMFISKQKLSRSIAWGIVLTGNKKNAHFFRQWRFTCILLLARLPAFLSLCFSV